MATENHIDLTITRASLSVQRAGFGLPAVLCYNAPFVDKRRLYSNTADLVSDGFLADDPVVLWATKAFSQNPSVGQVAVLSGELPPTLTYEIVPTVSNGTTYSIEAQNPGQAPTQVDFVSDADATATEIVDGLLALLNALPSKNFTVTNVGDVLTAVGDAAGDWFSLECKNPSLLSMRAVAPDPGVATDLNAIVDESNDWYALDTLYNASTYVDAVASWVEAQLKIYVVSSSDTEAMLVAAASGTDAPATLSNSNYSRTAPFYHQSPAAFASAVALGGRLSLDPGEATWKFLVGQAIEATKLTGTRRQNLVDRDTNFFEVSGGQTHLSEGTMADGGFIDIIRGIDWIYVNQSADLLQAFLQANKIPFTDAGAAILETAIRANLATAVGMGILASFTISVPLVEDVSADDRANRCFGDITWEGTLAGAVHGVKINGKVAI